MTTDSRPVFTCASCHAVFPSGETQRSHYQSDWHRYNLRRKVADLPPVTEAVFGTKLEALNKGNAQQIADATRKSYDCEACRKCFSSVNAFEDHRRSGKHLERAAADSPMTVRELQSATTTSAARPPPADAFLAEDTTEEQIGQIVRARLAAGHRLSPEECIFCPQRLPTFEANVEHMTKQHGLYIPDLDFVEDLAGLLGYLADKVAVAFCCLYCPCTTSPFASLESVRRHMFDKGHLKIRFDDEGMQELADFYNYEEVVSDDGDEDYEDVSDGGEEEEYDGLVVSPDGSQLALPSGKLIGNRAYRIYYRQNLRPHPPPETRPSRRSEHQAQLVRTLSDHYAATGMAGPLAQSHLERAQRRQYNERKDWDVRVGIRGNALQEHFRYQLRQ